MSKYDCFVIGNALFDVIFNAERQIQIVPGGAGYCRNFYFSPGGAGNVAVALALLGEKTVFAGKVGNDRLGQMYVNDLKQSRVQPKIFIDKHLATGVALTLSSPKERSFLVYRGANTNLNQQEIKTLKPLIAESKLFYFTGFALTEDPQRKAILKAAEIARAFKCKVVFDPGSHNLIRQNPSMFLNLLQLTDVLSLNELEAKAITNCNRLDKATRRLRTCVPLTAIRLGAKGSILVTNEAIVKTPAGNVKPKDSTGAGDAYTAALMHGLNLNLPLSDVGLFANWFASQKVKNYGARAFPKTKECTVYLTKLKR